MIGFQCPECNCGMACPDSLEGQREICPDCGYACTIPNASSPAEQPPVSTSEGGLTSALPAALPDPKTPNKGFLKLKLIH